MTAADELLASCEGLLDQYEDLCRELGDQHVTARLDEVSGSNSAFALVTHVAGVMARWGRTVNRGLPVPRDRDAEFRASGTVEEALALLARARRDLVDDVRTARLGDPPVAPRRTSRTPTRPRARSCSTSTRSSPSTSGSWR